MGRGNKKSAFEDKEEKRDLCSNNILLILKRMVEHNAVIYVYCDFNLKLLRPDTVLECIGDVCNGLCHIHNR